MKFTRGMNIHSYSFENPFGMNVHSYHSIKLFINFIKLGNTE
ncbi:hypothetical protein bthur0003_27220 [Bacillus thuringiensis serovar thuringiensis str. T01001]|nr:hypothetical protein H175_ch2987 [Bacillus thuringiensis serovar thuringiensis str. IS5056]EEM28475.1 hypothetical protein bthur0002_27190 [Bacillus thuringiensis Bt407]EEM34815.1 hypothetical protein bthur0003_27220 [Bacillus thuringiensis serovar thuringiensis str. T01001]EEM65725.1 hypothetical protein bthur0008_27130 [Bacillus thuringiensis serovar berliner ATCC 10792]